MAFGVVADVDVIGPDEIVLLFPLLQDRYQLVIDAGAARRPATRPTGNCDWSMSMRAATMPASTGRVQRDAWLRAEHDALDGVRQQVAVAEQILAGEFYVGAAGRGLDNAGERRQLPATFWLTSTSADASTPW